MNRFTHTYKDSLGRKWRLIRKSSSPLPGFAFYQDERGRDLQIHDHDVVSVATPMITRKNPDVVQDIEDFHHKFEVGYEGPPRSLPPDLEEFRMKFFEEEFLELTTAETDELKLDACVDLVYIILGYCHLRGWDFAEGWRRVHSANMQKVRARTPAESKRGSKWDVVKPDDWKEPSLKDLV